VGALAREVLAEPEAVEVDADPVVPLLRDAEVVADPRGADDLLVDRLADRGLDVLAVLGLLFGRGVQPDRHVAHAVQRRLVLFGVDELLQFRLRELTQPEEPPRGEISLR